MRVTVDCWHSLAAVVIGGLGFMLVSTTAFGVLPIGFAWLGIAQMMVGCVIWLHGQINRIVERMACREDAAFNLGKLAAVRERC